MHEAVREFIVSLQPEISRQEEQARFYEGPQFLQIEEITGRKLNGEFAAKCRKWSQELREMIKSLSS